MQDDTVPIRSIATELRDKFLARFMASQTKKQKISRLKQRRPGARRTQGSGALLKAKLSPGRPLKEPAPADDVLARDDEEPKAEDLAKEEPIKPEEVEEVTAAIEAVEPGA